MKALGIFGNERFEIGFEQEWIRVHSGRRGLQPSVKGLVIDKLTGARIYSDRTWNRPEHAQAWARKVAEEYMKQYDK